LEGSGGSSFLMQLTKKVWPKIWGETGFDFEELSLGVGFSLFKISGNKFL